MEHTKETQKYIILELVNNLEQKKRITYKDISKLEKLINEYDEFVFDRDAFFQNCWDICYQSLHPHKRLYLINCSTGHCYRHFETNRECFDYIKRQLKFRNIM